MTFLARAAWPFTLASVLVLAVSGAFAADEPSVEQLVLELRGQAPAVKRSGPERQAAYDGAAAALLARAAEEIPSGASESALTLQEINFHASRPGAEAERLAASKAMLPHLDPKTPEGVRLWILRQLERIGRAECVPAVAPLLDAAEDRIRERALRVLETNPAPAAADALRAALERATDPARRVSLALALGYRRDDRSVTLLEKALADSDATVAAAAADALGAIATAKAGAALASAKVVAGAEAALDDARARCALARVAAGDRSGAEVLSLALAAEGRPAESRAMGLRGLVAARSPRALPAVLAALEAKEPRLRQAAAALCAALRDRGAITEIANLYPKLDPATQTVLLAALTERKAVDALPMALQSLASEDSALRAAATKAVGVLGGPKAVLPLAEIAAKGERTDQQLARSYLADAPGKDVDEAVLDLARGGASEVRAALMGVVADRKLARGPAFLLEMAGDADAAVAAEAAKALGRVASPEQYGEMVKLLLVTKDGNARMALQDAVVANARRLEQVDAAADPVLAALPIASDDNKVSLIEMLAALGGDKALAEITRAAASEDPEIKRTAVQALAEGCDDTRALPILLNIARGDAERVLKVQAMRGYLRILGQSAEAKPDEAIQRLTEAMAAAQRPEEKKQILGVLRNCRVPAAVALAAKCLDDEAVAAEATDAVLHLSSPRKRGNRTIPPVKGPEVSAALGKIAKLRGEGVPDPWSGRDIGDVGAPGWVGYSDGKFLIRASGADIWGKADAFHFVSQPLSGDATITARLESLENTNVWAKAGVMIRETMEPGSPVVFMAVTPGNGATFQKRLGADIDTGSVKNAGIVAPYWVKLTRAGDLFTGSISTDGQEWAKVGEVTLKMAKDVLIGLAATSHTNDAVTRAAVDQVVVAR